ncbi:transferase [Arthrobacter sp. NPDC093139]|uniref:PglD-related sugar-binding protein n=1 Tax=Arthrobacter sp. NPDC093139 TaxID=3363945 RepID=UPI0038175756
MGAWLILGASGHARSLASIVNGRGDYVAAVSDAGLAGAASDSAASERSLSPFAAADGRTPTVFFDDDEALRFAAEKSLSIAVGIGDNGVRKRVAESIIASSELVHLTVPLVAASATVDPTARLGPLSQVCEHAHVGPLADIGSAVIINTGAIVEHEAGVGSGTHLAPGSVLLGASFVGNRVFVGSGARVLPGCTVGGLSVIGAGAVVTRDLAGGATYIGVPARELTSKKGATL